MSVFEIIGRVIKRLEEPLARKHGEELDNHLTEKLAYLSEGYKRLHGSNSHAIDYSDPATRWCYIYKYAAPHADYLHKTLRHAKAATKEPLFQSESIRVACLGGGPGSDVLGVIRYLISQIGQEPVRAVHFDVFDLENGWGSEVAALLAEAGSDVAFSAEFHRLDVSDAQTWQDVDFSIFDMVTASFFVSEIRRIGLGKPARTFWQAVLRSIRPGCMIAFNDNNDERITGYFDEIARSTGGFETLILKDGEVSCNDSWSPVQEWIDRFDHRPKRKGNVASRVLRKAA